MSEPTATELLKERLFAAYQSRKFTAIWDIVQAQMQINIAAESRAGDMELEIARLTTLVAEGERREALLTERVLAQGEWEYVIGTSDEITDLWLKDISAYEERFSAALRRLSDSKKALTDAGFTPDGWAEDQS